jgi:hypothetical protein
MADERAYYRIGDRLGACGVPKASAVYGKKGKCVGIVKLMGVYMYDIKCDDGVTISLPQDRVADFGLLADYFSI